MHAATANSAPAYSSKNAAFFRLFTDISGLLDEKERRLYDVGFRDEQSPDNFQPCKYSDSRQGLLINQAALHEIIAEWESAGPPRHHRQHEPQGQRLGLRRHGAVLPATYLGVH